MLKRLQLEIRRFFRQSFKGIGFKISILFLLVSVAVSLMLIAPNCFNRVPIYSYFIREFELPITYELTGKVIIVDAEGNMVDSTVDIFAGGYSATANSNDEFVLNFSAPITSEIFIVIRFSNFGDEIITKTERLEIKSGVHKIEEVFRYNV